MAKETEGEHFGDYGPMRLKRGIKLAQEYVNLYKKEIALKWNGPRYLDTECTLFTGQTSKECTYHTNSGGSFYYLNMNKRTKKTQYLVRWVEVHEIGVLRLNKNNYYSLELKLEIINKVLIDNQSVKRTAVEYGLARIKTKDIL